MIVKKYDYRRPLPIYEVQELTLEQAMRLLCDQRRIPCDMVDHWLENRPGVSRKLDEMQQVIEMV
jgi:hypothetical protein